MVETPDVRRPNEISVDDRPDGAVGGDLGLGPGVDCERQRLTVDRDHVGLVLVAVDHHQAGLSDRGQCLPVTQGGQTERRAETHVDRVDGPRLGGRVVQNIGTLRSFSDGQLLALGARHDAAESCSAVPVGEHDATGGLVHEPTGGPSRGGVDRRKSVSSNDDDDGEQTDERHRGSGDGLAPGHGRQCHAASTVRRMAECHISSSAFTRLNSRDCSDSPGRPPEPGLHQLGRPGPPRRAVSGDLQRGVDEPLDCPWTGQRFDHRANGGQHIDRPESSCQPCGTDCCAERDAHPLRRTKVVGRERWIWHVEHDEAGIELVGPFDVEEGVGHETGDFLRQRSTRPTPREGH